MVEPELSSWDVESSVVFVAVALDEAFVVAEDVDSSVVAVMELLLVSAFAAASVDFGSAEAA